MTKIYFELLKDPRWQKKRLEILERDKWTCQICKRTDQTLNVHHASYNKNKSPWQYPNCTLVTLCESCHESEKKYLYGIIKNFTDMLRENGFISRDFSQTEICLKLLLNIMPKEHLIHELEKLCDSEIKKIV